jgi:diacylglycerol kinase family enzyme
MRTSEQKTNNVFYVVVNAGSGRAETEQRCSTIKDVLERAGRACHLALVDDPSRLASTADDMATRAAASGSVLVAAGGDGTINTVAHAALRHGCTFGVLPQGTFNYFGRTNGVPEDLAGAVDALLHSKVRRVQIGMVNQRIFLVNASVGLYPRLLEEREHDKQQYGRSRLVALLSAIKTALRPHRRLHITLELDGKLSSLRTSTLFVGNNRLQMEQLGLEPLGEALDEGQLAALAPKPVGRAGLLGLLLRGAVGNLAHAPQLHAFAFRKMTVHAPRVYGRRWIKVATDGEVTELQMPLEFQAVEGRLALLVPEPGLGESAAGDNPRSRHEARAA